MAHNAAYQRNTIEADVFDTLFRKPADPVAMENIKESRIWKLLKALKIGKKHYEDGNKYDLVRNKIE